MDINPKEIKQEQKRAPKTFEVTLNKAVFMDGEKLGNAGGIVSVESDVLKQLKKSGVIDENA